MVLATELGDLRRFENPRQLMAYLGLVPSEHSSGDRRRQGAKRLQRKHGKAKALSILAARLGRSVYFMLKNQEAFDMDRFFA